MKTEQSNIIIHCMVTKDHILMHTILFFIFKIVWYLTVTTVLISNMYYIIYNLHSKPALLLNVSIHLCDTHLITYVQLFELLLK